MHFGWALLAAWNVRGRRLKVAAWIFTGLTAFATIGIGEHYFIDLIVAVPFCWAVQWIAERSLTQRLAEVKTADVDGVRRQPVASP
jgi:hypothetical protein